MPPTRAPAVSAGALVGGLSRIRTTRVFATERRPLRTPLCGFFSDGERLGVSAAPQRKLGGPKTTEPTNKSGTLADAALVGGTQVTSNEGSF